MEIAYKVVVNGSYRAFGDDSRSKRVKFFEPETFILPERVQYVNGRKKILESPAFVEPNPHTGEKPPGKWKVVPNIIEANGLRVARSVICRYYLEPRLKAKYPDFSSYREVHVVSTEKVDLSTYKLKASDNTDTLVPPTPENINKLGDGGLKLFCALFDLNTNIESYPDLRNRRAAVRSEYDSVYKTPAVGAAVPGVSATDEPADLMA